MSWFSKALEKSKRKGTGIFSWGESNLGNVLDPSGKLDSYLDTLPIDSGPRPSTSEIAGGIPLAQTAYGNKEILMLLGALVAYKVFFK